MNKINMIDVLLQLTHVPGNLFKGHIDDLNNQFIFKFPEVAMKELFINHPYVYK